MKDGLGGRAWSQGDDKGGNPNFGEERYDHQIETPPWKEMPIVGTRMQNEWLTGQKKRTSRGKSREEHGLKSCDAREKRCQKREEKCYRLSGPY